MIIETGVWPSCSETVFRIPNSVKDKLPEQIMAATFFGASEEPVEGYSQMRPIEGTFCLYYYQTSGDVLCRWLEDNKIPYDVQFPFGDDQENWEEILPSEEEKKNLAEGGQGLFYKRKPYAD